MHKNTLHCDDIPIMNVASSLMLAYLVMKRLVAYVTLRSLSQAYTDNLLVKVDHSLVPKGNMDKMKPLNKNLDRYSKTCCIHKT